MSFIVDNMILSPCRKKLQFDIFYDEPIPEGLTSMDIVKGLFGPQGENVDEL